MGGCVGPTEGSKQAILGQKRTQVKKEQHYSTQQLQDQFTLLRLMRQIQEKDALLEQIQQNLSQGERQLAEKQTAITSLLAQIQNYKAEIQSTNAQMTAIESKFIAITAEYQLLLARYTNAIQKEEDLQRRNQEKIEKYEDVILHKRAAIQCAQIKLQRIQNENIEMAAEKSQQRRELQELRLPINSQIQDFTKSFTKIEKVPKQRVEYGKIQDFIQPKRPQKKYFSGKLLFYNMKASKFLKNVLQSSEQRKLKQAQLIFNSQISPKTGLSKQLCNRTQILIVGKVLQTRYLFGCWSRGRFTKQQTNNNALLLLINDQLVIKKKEKKFAGFFDENYILIGNSQITIDSTKKLVKFRMGILNSCYEVKEINKQLEFSQEGIYTLYDLEIYQLQFQKE